MESKPASVDWKTYEELCEEEVLKLTGIKFRTKDGKDRPILEFDFREGSGWSFERIVQIFHIYNTNTHFDELSLLIELYREEPIRLHQQLVTTLDAHDLLEVSLHKSRDEQYNLLLETFPLSLGSATEIPLFRGFVRAIVPCKNGMETKIRTLLIETAGLMLSRVEDSQAFNIYVNTAFKMEPKGIFKRSRPPIIIGLHSIFSKRFDEFQKTVVKYIKTWCQPRRDKQLGGLVSRWDSIKQYGEKPFQFAFAPSGSGKTTSVFNQLTREYGYYMVSCALNERKNISVRGIKDPLSWDSRQTCMDPKLLQGVSRDTGEIFTMLNYIKPLSGYPSNLQYTCILWWQNIFLTRSKVFHWFRKARLSDSSPALWLSFQLDCSEWDPFLQTFRVASLFSPSSLFNFESQWSDETDGIDKEVHWACVDEAQEDLRSVTEQENLLAACMMAMNRRRYGKDQDHDFAYFRQVIFAGTSLNVSRALKTRDKISEFVRGWDNKDDIWHKNAYNVASRFPLVMNRVEAEAVLKASGIENAASAVDQGEPLWGRVKWTAMYAKKVIDEKKKGKETDFDALSEETYQQFVSETFAKEQGTLDFNKMAEETFDEITYDLCARLEDLQKRGNCGELLDRLLEAAISADILGRPHVFSEKSDLPLVEHGFAIVESWMNQLESKLKRHFTVVGRMESQLTVTLKENQPVEDGIVRLLAEVDKAGCALKNCPVDEWTDEMLRAGFIIVDCTMVKLATDLEEDGFTIVDKSGDTLTVKPGQGFIMIKDLTTEIVKKGFTIWGDNKGKRLQSLMKPVEVKNITDNRSFARLREGGDIAETKVMELEERLRKNGFLVMDKTTDLPTNLPHDDFTIQGSHRKAHLREHWKGRLRGQKFEIDYESVILLRAKLKKGESIEPKKGKELATALREDGFKIINKTIDELEQRVKGSCIIVNNSTNLLVARLAECVVIEAVIRFFIGNHKLDEKFMTSVRLASTRSGIGHSSEHYLAVQLRRYLSKASFDDDHPSRKDIVRYETELREKRGLILGCLSSATDDENNKIENLDDFALIAGDRTVKNFQSRLDWENGFVDWLCAIEHGHKSSASFLIPHNDFGPDLVFAMRKTDESKDIVLCSIQLKLGRGSPDAVNKSSVSWACGDGKTGNASKNKEKETTEQRVNRLDDERENLDHIKTWVNKEEESLKLMIDANSKKNLHAELLNMLDVQLKNTEKMKSMLQNQSSKVPDHILQPLDMSKAREILQNDFWCHQSRLSMLVTAGAQTDHRLGDVRPDTSPFDPSREYYVLVGAENTTTLFGTPFQTVLKIL